GLGHLQRRPGHAGGRPRPLRCAPAAPASKRPRAPTCAAPACGRSPPTPPRGWASWTWGCATAIPWCSWRCATGAVRASAMARPRSTRASAAAWCWPRASSSPADATCRTRPAGSTWSTPAATPTPPRCAGCATHSAPTTDPTAAMPIDFDQIDEAGLRAAGGLKWTAFPDCIGAFVAEMDFGLAPPVAAALQEAVARGRTGYPTPALSRELAQACAAWQAGRYGWQVDP